MPDERRRISEQTDAAGGIVKLVTEGVIQSQVSAQAYRMQRAIESGAFPKVGVNRYRSEGDAGRPVEMHPYKADDAKTQIAALKQVRASGFWQQVEIGERPLSLGWRPASIGGSLM